MCTCVPDVAPRVYVHMNMRRDMYIRVAPSRAQAPAHPCVYAHIALNTWRYDLTTHTACSCPPDLLVRARRWNAAWRVGGGACSKCSKCSGCSKRLKAGCLYCLSLRDYRFLSLARVPLLSLACAASRVSRFVSLASCLSLRVYRFVSLASSNLSDVSSC